jgi:hypothetical protein
MRSNAGMANRQGDVDLRFAQFSAPPLSTLAWFGLVWCVVSAQSGGTEPVRFTKELVIISPIIASTRNLTRFSATLSRQVVQEKAM